jgi:uracil-DNA glycosylase
MPTRHTSHGPHHTRSTDDKSPRGDEIARHLNALSDLRDAVNSCRRCDLWKNATQGVPGEGPAKAHVMLVGEQPGDQEDQQGHPFVGPAGAILSRALHEAGITRKDVYVSNAVKHFKFEPRGKRRLHVKPNVQEIEACRWWLSEELKFVQPKVIVALGASAARSLLGHPVTVSSMRGLPTPFENDAHVWVTVHPSYLLRIPDEVSQRAEYSRFVHDLEGAMSWLKRHSK